MRTAAELDTLFTNLGQRFDQYSGSLSKVVGDTVQSALSKWQDFYYSGSWPDSELLRWEAAYMTALKLLEAEIASGIREASANQAAAKRKQLEVLRVSGGDPLNMPDFRTLSPALLLLGALPMVWLLLRGK